MPRIVHPGSPFERKGQPGLSTSHRANEAQLSMPPSRATSRTPRLSYGTIGSEQRQAVLQGLIHLGAHMNGFRWSPRCWVVEDARLRAAYDRLIDYATGVQR